MALELHAGDLLGVALGILVIVGDLRVMVLYYRLHLLLSADGADRHPDGTVAEGGKNRSPECEKCHDIDPHEFSSCAWATSAEAQWVKHC